MTKNPAISGYSRSRGKQFTATASRKQNGTNSPTQLSVFHGPMETRKCKIEKQTKKKIYYVQEKNLKALPANFAKSHTGEQNVLINSRDLISTLAMLTAGPQEATAVVQS